jgi:uncharacterized repeat protein (TIGR03809 family)
MTDHFDVALRRDLLARWCLLAEQRLSHLTELFESGRWRRYYSERAFLENIREAKKAVETWRTLSGRPIMHVDDGPPVETDFADADVVVENPPSLLAVDLVALEKALLVAPPPVTDLATMEQRYPLLRNAL